MLVLINPIAGGGNAVKKMNKLKLGSKYYNNSTILTGDKDIDEKVVKNAIYSQEKEFIAAGGDGTLSFLLNSIMKFCCSEKMKSVKIGAIGLGSSNDFHKPFINGKENSIPMKTNFKTAKYRDIGRFKYQRNKKTFTKYYLINASIGLTAEGNYLFNNPNKILSILKKYNTASAIYYTIFKTISDYQNIDAMMQLNCRENIRVNITNLGIVKSPYFSGNLSFNSILDLDNGMLNVHLSKNLNKVKSMLLLRQLGIPKSKKNLINNWKVKSISISSDKDFKVEFDGETISTNSVKFDVIPKKIMVCET